MLLELIATVVTPYLQRIWELSIAKIFRDIDASIRAAMFTPLLYDYAKRGFAYLLGTTHGLQVLMAAFGTFISAYLMLGFGFTGTFWISGLIAFIAITIFQSGFTERVVKTRKAIPKDLRKAFSWNIPRNLKLLSFNNLVWFMGSNVSHSFIMPLFFMQKFNVSVPTAAIIQALHRISNGLPAVLLSQGFFKGANFSQKQMKIYAFLASVFCGAMIAVTGLSPNFWIAVIAWCVHDMSIGIKNPSQGTLVQQFSSDETRGRDTNIANSFGKVGGIIGPILAGYFASLYLSLPYIMSGTIMIISSIFFLSVKEGTANSQELDIKETSAAEQ